MDERDKELIEVEIKLMSKISIAERNLYHARYSFTNIIQMIIFELSKRGRILKNNVEEAKKELAQFYKDNGID